MRLSIGLRHLRSLQAVEVLPKHQCRQRGAQTLLNQRRCIHKVPNLTLREDGSYVFLNAQAVKTAWTDYHQWIVDNLNRLTQGTGEYAAQVKDVAIRAARDPARAALFNFASMAHNNSLFFDGIISNPTPMPNFIELAIQRDFSSVESLRETMIATADTMFGPGFVWLVKRNDQGGSGKLAILNTYLAGSPYAGAHWRKQSVDMNTEDNFAKPGEGAALWVLQNQDKTPTYGLFGGKGTAGDFIGRATGGQPKAQPGSANIEPLLCVNTWPHVYLQQFGVAGKRDYLEQWWEHINWERVRRLHSPPKPSTQR